MILVALVCLCLGNHNNSKVVGPEQSSDTILGKIQIIVWIHKKN